MTTELQTSNEELLKLVKEGYFFNFCISFALNKGYRDAIKENKDVKFSVGDYDVEFNREEMCFILTHKIYFARIITAHYNGFGTTEVVFIGGDEQEVISDLLAELQKELQTV